MNTTVPMNAAVKAIKLPAEERKCGVSYTTSDAPTWHITAPRTAGLSSEEVMAWVKETIAANPGSPIYINFTTIGTVNGAVNINPAPVMNETPEDNSETSA